jgi:hypothetical protein
MKIREEDGDEFIYAPRRLDIGQLQKALKDAGLELP